MIDQGRVVTEGPAKEVLARYISEMESRRLDLLTLDRNQGRVRVVAVTCHNAAGVESTRFAPDDPIEIRLQFETDEPLERPHVVVGITDGRPGVLIECSMLDDDSAPDRVGRRFEVSCLIDRLPLRPRLYEIWCDVIAGDGYGRLSDWIQVGGFNVVAAVGTGKKAVVNAANAGAVAVGCRWEVRS